MKPVLIVALATLVFGVAGFASAGDGASRFALTLQVIGPGTVVARPGVRCTGYLTRVHSCRSVYAGGTKVTLTAVPRINARLSSWRGAGLGAKTRTVAMTAPKLVTATFAKVAVRTPPPPPPAGSTRADPLPLGATMTYTSSDEKWAVRILSTQPDATAEVLAENQFNDPPAPGHQFFIATVVETYLSGTKAEGSNSGFELRTVGPSNVVYTTFGNSCGVIPDDIDLKGEVLPGASLTGDVCWDVPSSEAASLIAFWDFSDKPFWMALR